MVAIDSLSTVASLASLSARFPNGLAFSPDESVLYVANTGATQYVHRLELNPDGTLKRRKIFADMSSAESEGAPDGMRADAAERVYCAGSGGTWVSEPDGTKLATIRTPERPAKYGIRGA